ncbi:type VII secretion-associated serine protease mycosin [Streptomyces sp. NPDC051569]|uniref:type VII secretion-associated serine protease mycosin n=1 Tax=Streptomyces sp. NPDC051569 TaxID=3365661 RepID=UPI003793C680
MKKRNTTVVEALGVLNMGVLLPRSRTRARTRTRGTDTLRRVLGVLAATGLCLSASPAAPADASPSTSGPSTSSPSTSSPSTSGPSTSGPGPDTTDFGLTSSSECVFGGGNITATPWSLQRILLDQLRGESTGKGVTVAVIDTGVDGTSAQLGPAVIDGKDFVGSTNGTQDVEGHGTRVAGIIAARAIKGTGFAGIAPDAKILPIRYTGAEDKQGDSATMTEAIRYALSRGAEIINISSDTTGRKDNIDLRNAVQDAVDAGVLIVAAAGNDGADGTSARTYPASYDGVLAVAASDRNDERAYFSQAGDFVDVAAPGVGMVSTVPKGGQCTADGTSFAAPYVTGVAALLKAKNPDWTAAQISTRIQETAKRPGRGPNRFLGWGVVDPVAALTDDSTPANAPALTPRADMGAAKVIPMEVTMGESDADRDRRVAMYVMGGSLVLVLLVSGSGVVLRDWRRKQAAAAAR